MASTALGQASRFEELYRAHGPRLLRNVLLYSGDREIANDAVAEAFAQAMRRGEAVEGDPTMRLRNALLLFPILGFVAACAPTIRRRRQRHRRN